MKHLFIMLFLLIAPAVMAQTTMFYKADSLGSRTAATDSIVATDPIFVLQSIVAAADTFVVQMRWYTDIKDTLYGGWITVPYYNMKTAAMDTSGIIIVNPPEVEYIKINLGFRAIYRIKRYNTAWADLVNRRLMWNCYLVY